MLTALGFLTACSPQPQDSDAASRPTSGPADPGASGAFQTPTPDETRPGSDLGPEVADGISPCTRSPADVMSVIGKQSTAINKCLIAGQRQKRLTKGTRTIDLEFLIMPSGKVEGVQVRNKNTRDNTLQICIGKVLDKATFPVSKGGTCPMELPLNVAVPTKERRSRRR